MAADAMRFHTQLKDAETARPESLAATHAIVGVRQPTPTTARITHGRAVALGTYRGDDLLGDATVPIVGRLPRRRAARQQQPVAHPGQTRQPAAQPRRPRPARRHPHRKPVVVRAADTSDATVDIPELILTGQPLPIQITLTDRAAARITVTSETGQLIAARVTRPPHHTTIDGLPPGAYTIDVTGLDPSSPITPVGFPGAGGWS